MEQQRDRPLALFDFDGTLVRLATDYEALRGRLDELGGDGEGLLEQLLSLREDPGAQRLADDAELAGLKRGEEVEAGLALYRSFATDGTSIAIVSHNGRAVIERFFAQADLPPPDDILDRRALAAPKDESEAVRTLVAGRNPVYVIGDAQSDRRLAERLGATYLDVADELRSYYEGRADELDELALTYEHPEPYKRFFYRARFEAVLGALDAQPGERILEVGCGSGAYTRALAEAGAEVTATEFAPGPLAQARRNLGPLAERVDLRVADAQELPFEDESFDRVLLSEVIEHVPRPERAIEEAARALGPRGLLAVSTPSRFSPLNLAYDLKRRVRGYAFNEHLHEFTPGSFRRLLTEHFTVERLEFANFLLPYPADELYLRLGSPALGVLRGVERTLSRIPLARKLGWTMVASARKPA